MRASFLGLLTGTCCEPDCVPQPGYRLNTDNGLTAKCYQTEHPFGMNFWAFPLFRLVRATCKNLRSNTFYASGEE